MKQDKLTPQEAALYLGQQIVYERFPLRGFSYNVIDASVIADIASGKINKCKIALRPLSDITEEEAKKVARITDVLCSEEDVLVWRNPDRIIAYHKYDDAGCDSKEAAVHIVFNHHDICTWSDGNFDNLDFHRSSEIMAFLLSKGFDLFNWIEQGKALDKTKHSLTHDV